MTLPLPADYLRLLDHEVLDCHDVTEDCTDESYRQGNERVFPVAPRRRVDHGKDKAGQSAATAAVQTCDSRLPSVGRGHYQDKRSGTGKESCRDQRNPAKYDAGSLSHTPPSGHGPEDTPLDLVPLRLERLTALNLAAGS